MPTDIPQYGATSDGTPNPRHEIPLPPISQLPTELLVSILHLALPLSDLSQWPLGYGVHSYMPMLYTLRGVSKQWQEVVERTPSFWALLLSTLPPHVNDIALLRSGSHPLAIVYKRPRDGSKDKHPSPEDFLSTAVKAFHRWLSYSGPALSEYPGTPTPLIQNITLSDTFHGQSTEEPLELLGGCTASLRYIEVSGVSVRWRAGLFTQLKVLDLTRVGQDGLNLSTILDFLRASPQLERLRLYRVRATHDSAQSSSVITLHHLRSISIYDCDVTEHILRQIRAPSCIDFEVDVVPDSDHLVPRFLDEALHHFRGMLQAIHARNGSSEVIFSSSGFHWYIPGGGVDGHDFYVVIFCFSPISCIRWAEQILHSDAGLSIGFSLDADTTDIVLESIAPMRCVTKVVVEELRNKHEILRILQFISKPLTAGALVPLPCLREVWLTSTKWNDQDLLDMVQSRVNYLSLETEERPPLTISITRGAFTWRNTPRPIVDYATLNKIREISGIERVQFVGSEELDGMLAVTWNEQAGVPIWG